MSVVKEIRCSHCGAPIKFNPGEILATCPYCGFTQVIETGKAFVFEHSMILNKYDATTVETPIREWMKSGFLKPGDLAKSKIIEKNLVYLPFWIVPTKATTSYKGVFERITPPVVKEGKIEKEYNWLVLARKATQFPTREYEVPLEAKIPYDFRRVEGFAKVLNSERQQHEAVEIAKQEIESLHQFLMKEDVDKIIEAKTEFKIGDVVYLHAPVWFVTYEYKRERYNLFMDGATGNVIKGDIPSIKVGLF
ncbi:MAG: zinc ribbon domain-containing protein [Candidatus Bathyarchaeia archaeon]